MTTAGCQKSANKKPPGASASEASADGESAEPQGFKPQSTQDLSAPIARVDGIEITVQQLQDAINRQTPYVRARYRSNEQKRAFLDNVIRFEILAGEARRRGLDRDPDVVQTMKSAMITKLLKDALADDVNPDDITDAEMKAYFEAHAGDFHTPEQVRVSAIIVDNKRRADDLAAQAMGESGSTHRGFRDMVTKYSKDEETKLRGGDLRYFGRDTTEVPAAVVEAAFALDKTGDIAGPIAVGKRYYIIKQTGRHREIAKTFEQVKRHIQSELYKDRRENLRKSFVDQLRTKAKIEVYEGNLAKVRVEGKK